MRLSPSISHSKARRAKPTPKPRVVPPLPRAWDGVYPVGLLLLSWRGATTSSSSRSARPGGSSRQRPPSIEVSPSGSVRSLSSVSLLIAAVGIPPQCATKPGVLLADDYRAEQKALQRLKVLLQARAMLLLSRGSPSEGQGSGERLRRKSACPPRLAKLRSLARQDFLSKSMTWANVQSLGARECDG